MVERDPFDSSLQQVLTELLEFPEWLRIRRAVCNWLSVKVPLCFSIDTKNYSIYKV